MFSRASDQVGFFDAAELVGPLPEGSFFALLAEHGHRIVRDEDFAECYSAGRRRPSIPPSLLAKVLLMEYRTDCSDEQAMESIAWDLCWKIALGLAVDHRGFHPTTLTKFRARLLLHGKERLALENTRPRCARSSCARRTGTPGRRSLPRSRSLGTDCPQRDVVGEDVSSVDAVGVACQDQAMSVALPSWSVRLLLTNEECQAISSPDALILHNAIIRMAIGGFHDDEMEEVPFITYELYAQTAEEAEDLAQQLAGFSLKEAGLESRERFPVVWTAPLRDEEESSHRFLEQAKDLFGADQFELAIVAAQIHFEMQVRLLLERAAVRIGTPWARRLTKHSRVATLSNEISTASVQLLLGADVTTSTLWPEYVAHLKRRNAIVHEGKMMISKDAGSSIRVVQDLWASLAEAERSMTLF